MGEVDLSKTAKYWRLEFPIAKAWISFIGHSISPLFSEITTFSSGRGPLAGKMYEIAMPA